MREIGDDVKNSLVSAVENFRIVSEKQKSMGLDKNAISSFANNSFKNLIETLPNNFANKLAVSLGIDLVKEPDWELAPSLVAMGTLAGYVGKITTLSGRKARVSNFGDIYIAFKPHHRGWPT